ncbi:MAG: pilus assembly protein PilM [candidate division KSB1 bacterium]|nr:pilus assembly protein PilM [candidate division KSB1 bacterium]MDZ7335250.1 pilus assembly protein PilM [candidate division KSB1 bacterium]MDZ7358000.1 pilus assembly protein PilM [candidate division KSB1 bacterium]MDZ7399787.1 pilus assembly protein PilM [candidate division KSB1 bacterium]
MDANPTNIQLGIYIRDRNVKLIEVESTSQQFRINKIIQTELNTPLNIESICNDQRIEDIGSQLQQLVRNYRLNAQKTIFALQNQFALIKKLPYESDLSDSDLIDQVDWEVKQFSYHPSDEYIVDFQKLQQTSRRQEHEMLVVSVREKIIRQLRKLFSIAKLNVRVVDLDIFTAKRAIELNYELRVGDIIALVEVSSGGLMFTIIEDKEYWISQDLPAYKLDPTITSLDAADEDDIAKYVSKELRRVMLDNKVGESIEALNRIFLYGDLVKDSILENLQNNYNVRIDRANPFRRLLFAPNVSVDENIWSRPETFTVCVGAALRKK